MTTRQARRAAARKAAVSNLRDLTEAERAKLNQLVAPHWKARQEAEKLIMATLDAFLAALGLPPNVNVQLDTGKVSLRVTPAVTPNGVAKEVPEAAVGVARSDAR